MSGSSRCAGDYVCFLFHEACRSGAKSTITGSHRNNHGTADGRDTFLRCVWELVTGIRRIGDALALSRAAPEAYLRYGRELKNVGMSTEEKEEGEQYQAAATFVGGA